jgi:hypothetical protein
MTVAIAAVKRSFVAGRPQSLFHQLRLSARIAVFSPPYPQAYEQLRLGGSGGLMPRISKDLIRAQQFRLRATEVLRDPNWLDEGVRHWLEKELRREPDYIYTENEHAALERIIAAGTLFDEWDGYSVSELLAAASRYKRDGNYEDEQEIDELQSRNVAQLRLGEMDHLVAFCRNIAGLPLKRFEPIIIEDQTR